MKEAIILLHPDGDRYQHGMDGEPVGAQQGAKARVRSIGARHGSFPFPISGVDSDNGSEFITHELLRFCEEQQITFTRSRSRNKNDGAHVEEKDWSRVRELVA